MPLYFLLVYDSPYFWVGWILALLPWPLKVWRKGYLLPRTIFDIPILVFVIGLVVGLIYSDLALLSVGAFQSYLCVILFYYALADGHWTRDWKIWGGFWTLFFLLISIFIFSQVTLNVTRPTPFSERFFAMIPSIPNIFDVAPNINTVAAVLAVVIPVLFGISILGLKAHPRIRISAIILTIVFAFALALTISRGAWIAVGIALTIILIRHTKWALLLLLIAAGAMIWVWLADYDPLNILQIGRVGNIYRLEIWQLTVEILRGYPLIGCGLGAFPSVFVPYAPPQFSEHPNPHNAYLMLYSDMGIFGVLAAALATVILIITIVKMWRAPHKEPAYGMAFGIAAGVIALGIHAIFEASSAIIWIDSGGNYRYLASILPWIAAGSLAAVIKKRKTIAQALSLAKHNM
ncbi:O-antigen ligase family protein [Chloroflexota bacterium]